MDSQHNLSTTRTHARAANTHVHTVTETQTHTHRRYTIPRTNTHLAYLGGVHMRVNLTAVGHVGGSYLQFCCVLPLRRLIGKDRRVWGGRLATTTQNPGCGAQPPPRRFPNATSPPPSITIPTQSVSYLTEINGGSSMHWFGAGGM